MSIIRLLLFISLLGTCVNARKFKRPIFNLSRDLLDGSFDEYSTTLNSFDGVITPTSSSVTLPDGTEYTIYLNENGTLMEMTNGSDPHTIDIPVRDYSCGLSKTLINGTLDEYSGDIISLPDDAIGYSIDHDKPTDHVVDSEHLTESRRHLAVHPFFPNCFSNDQIPRILNIGITTDYSYYQLTKDKALSEIALMVAQVRLIFFLQLNVIVTVSDIKLTNQQANDADEYNSNFPLSMSLSTCLKDYSYVLQAFSAWQSTPSNVAVNILLTGCWPTPGTVGIAYEATACRTSRNVAVVSYTGPVSTWQTLAHEIGHTLNMDHENGGGLMSYSTHLWDGSLQFNPINKDQVCSFFNTILTCPYFAPDSSGGCGDNILVSEEECECLDGSSKCVGCIDCMLTNLKTECSTDVFIMHKSIGTVEKTVIVDRLGLSGTDCCSIDGKFKLPMTSCDNSNGICSNGQCIHVCSKFLMTGCDLTYNGCRQPCKGMGYTQCTDAIQTQTLRLPISYLPDRTKCSEAGGVCVNGQCSELLAELPDIPLGPTKQKTRRFRRHKRTFSPVMPIIPR